MLIGQSILILTDNAIYFGPWFPREADAATFALEILHISGGSITVTVQHKNSEDPDSSATTAGAFTSASTKGTSTKQISGLKELVRFKYEASAAVGTQWGHFRMNPPIWQPN